MARALPVWSSDNPDAAIPARVKLRVLEAHGHACALCRVEFAGKPVEFDHAIPLVLGGLHGEANLRPLCPGCHSGKSRADVALKAKVASVSKRHRGVKAPSRNPLACGRNSPWKRTIAGGTVRREEA